MMTYLPRALNLVKNVGDLKLMRGTTTISRKKGTVRVCCQISSKRLLWGDSTGSYGDKSAKSKTSSLFQLGQYTGKKKKSHEPMRK